MGISDDNAPASIATPALPDPPEDSSFESYVKNEWREIHALWRRGWSNESRLADLIDRIELRRELIFVARDAGSDFNWELDWIRANQHHKYMLDVVQNTKEQNSEIRLIWRQWHENVVSHFSEISIESLRTMVLLNGATILAALAVLSGQIANPSGLIRATAKVALSFSVISLAMVGTGHALAFAVSSEMASRVRGTIVSYGRHSRLRAISRYLQRHLDPKIRIANWLVYGSIAVFCLNACVCTIFLWSAG